MASQHVQDHAQNVYLTVTVSPSSTVFANPQSLAVDPAITYVGTVGQLPDVKMLSIPRDSWGGIQANVLDTLKGMDGVRRVDIEQPPRMRSKRNADEL